MNEEKDLKQQFGNHLEFNIPDGYFERMKTEVMQKIDQLPSVSPQAPKQKARLYRLATGIAASICVVIAGGALLFSQLHPADDTLAATGNDIKTMAVADDYEDDYIIIDNADMYMYLAEE